MHAFLSVVGVDKRFLIRLVSVVRSELAVMSGDDRTSPGDQRSHYSFLPHGATSSFFPVLHQALTLVKVCPPSAYGLLCATPPSRKGSAVSEKNEINRVDWKIVA